MIAADGDVSAEELTTLPELDGDADGEEVDVSAAACGVDDGE